VAGQATSAIVLIEGVPYFGALYPTSSS